MLKSAVLWINKKPKKVEEALNEWLAQHPNIRIQFVSQQPNFCYTIFYEE